MSNLLTRRRTRGRRSASGMDSSGGAGSKGELFMNQFTVKERWNLILSLSVGLFLLGLVVWPSYFSSPAAAAESVKQKTIQIRIGGMTCAACARGLEASFRKMNGVER